MNKEAQRIAIAEACGKLARKAGQTVLFQRPDEAGAVYQLVQYPDGSQRPCYISGIPDYLNDLNAMHWAEQMLNGDEQWRYTANIGAVAFTNLNQDFAQIHATAAQRAEAFLRTKGLWRE